MRALPWQAWAQLALFVAVIIALARPLGGYLFRVFEGARPWPRVFGAAERGLCRLCGVDPAREQTWQEYTLSLLLFSAAGMLVTYLLLRVQHLLPLNPQGFAAVEPGLAFDTAASFTTNTNWQSYSGESVLSYFSQMAGLAWHNFTSAAAGIGVALALARGLTRAEGPDGRKTLGSFYLDVIRGLVYVLIPACVVIALFFVSQGVLQSFSAYREVTTVEGIKQLLPMGPVASQEAIKMLGTNGGGFFNANSAHPFENPSPLTNFIQLLLIFAIPAALTNTYGRMARNQKQGWAIFAAMGVLFLAGTLALHAAESQDNAAMRGLALSEGVGNLEGKEARFGIGASALFATVTTDASCGAVNAMHDSFTPLGGLIPLVNIQLGEVIFGGVGAGLYGMLVFVILTVFIAGLMVGRTPELLGKKIEPREMKLAMFVILIFPFLILGLTAWSAVSPRELATLNNTGPHGLSELLYAASSAAGNNGSAFAGLNANTMFWNVALALVMLAGRFLMIIPLLAIAGSMVSKKVVAAGPGTFPTDGGLFAALLVAVVLIVGALTFFPALTLGPIVEHYLAAAGRLY